MEVAQFVELQSCTELSLHIARAVQLLGMQGDTRHLYFELGRGRG